MMQNDTIYALSSGSLPSGVAVIRISGPDSIAITESMVGILKEPGRLFLRNIVDDNGLVIDRGLVCKFIGPGSFTGEDCAEFHVHGGKAVVASLIDALGNYPDCRLAEPGEFSRRAFENGKLDFTEIEGLSDLIAAETETQRRQALFTSLGSARAVFEELRERIIHARAMIEAELDFAEEDDVPGSVSAQCWEEAANLANRISEILNDQCSGEIIREGYRIALMGKPNAGKSSLLNALAKRDIAIVSEEAGTTRDVLEVTLDIGGLLVVFYDTAGIRDTESGVEAEGIRRAKEIGSRSDMVLWLSAVDDDANGSRFSGIADLAENVVGIITKSDKSPDEIDGLSVSVVAEDGLKDLIGFIEDKTKQFNSGEPSLISRVRHRDQLEDCKTHLEAALLKGPNNIVLGAEELRLAGDCIGRITGRIDVEDLLDTIFSEFCIGK